MRVVRLGNEVLISSLRYWLGALDMDGQNGLIIGMVYIGYQGTTQLIAQHAQQRITGHTWWHSHSKLKVPRTVTTTLFMAFLLARRSYSRSLRRTRGLIVEKKSGRYLGHPTRRIINFLPLAEEKTKLLRKDMRYSLFQSQPSSPLLCNFLAILACYIFMVCVKD